ncbi:MAG: hypothetical protein JWL92_415 [Candidatus Nomurabacteria bacterium]|nr:hypothetical protein [Candidatus Nomurabacteria bacterium]
MTFTFSIRTALKKAWGLFAKHPYFFMGLALVMAILSAFSHTREGHGTPSSIALFVLVMIASVIWSYVWISATLAAVDGHSDLLNFRFISQHMPSLRQFFTLIGVGLLVGIIVAAGFILLIIPGFYFLVRLVFANTAYVDRQQGVRASLKYSWHLVQGKIYWTVFLVLLLEIGLFILGTIPFMIGLLVTYPLGMLLMTILYRDLTVYQKSLSEIPAETL